ncbi:oxysterol binding protein [Macrolepiota fuliginosa MF-IS2]|uniref:Oxysterol binding protein n=1 Tax=Macrolepiota fuliginosa MF-IS2 TaxID=1400762 RepID=A0A9P5XQJ7_9AGAR|nr:oxysterol binding protein [Macrolepiota fuliginosa MF-IS2]
MKGSTSVALQGTASAPLNLVTFKQGSSAQAVMCEGWVLKKRRKKMQGFARRYFVLYHNGLLQYSFEPGQPIRDQISLQHAAISTAPGRKDIHIDSNTATFHIKCLSTKDFDTWMTALRKFISLGIEARKSLNSRSHIRQASINLSKSEGLVDGMGVVIQQLEESILVLLHELPLKKVPSSSRKSGKDGHKDHHKDVFGLFKKHPHHTSGEFGVDGLQPDSSPTAQHVLHTLEQLKSQHAALLKSMQPRIVHEPQNVYHTPFPPTTEEHHEYENVHEHHSNTASTGLRHRHSIATTISDGTCEWYDAVDNMDDGPEEFVMDTQLSPEHAEQVSRIPTNDSRSSLEQFDRSSNETDAEEEKHPPRVSQDLGHDALATVRRVHLPSPVIGDEGSLFAILKKNVGKDLSTITFPVTFNEPLTLLQRAAEEVEYFSLLDEATQANNPVDRLSCVAAFAVSGYAHTRHRSGRKGFNPMLAETFEDIRMKFIAEKVRHNPVEMVYHAEGNGWELTATSAGRTKFWGKSLEIIPQGVTRLRIGDDHFCWTKPSSFMRNLMVGTKYLEHCGDMIVENLTNKYHCVLEFKQSGYWGPSNVVSGPVYSPTGEVVSHIEGKWDDQISQTLDSSHFRLLWRVNPFPKETQDYYGFTAFGITLNELTPNLIGKLPPTDSRNRPDVRALENGDVDTAEAAKLRIEEMQRERRKHGQDQQPRWFKQVGDEWVYVGGYWEARARGWKNENIQALW